MSDIPPPPPPPQPQPYPQPGGAQPPAPAPSPYQSPYAVPGQGPAPAPGYGAPPPPGFGGTPVPSFQSTAPTRSKKALWSMILGILGVSICAIIGIAAIVALILGILALKEIKRSGGALGGRGMAITGVVLGIIGILATAALAVIIVVFSDHKDVHDLEVGDCVELPEDGETISLIKTFDCSEPHGAEVISVGDLGDGDDPYPGDDEIQAQIAEECIADFERYVDSSFQTSVYQIFPLTPTESAWEDDQTYVCLAYEEGEELTGSIEGDGR
jgi:hypothetical protein